MALMLYPSRGVSYGDTSPLGLDPMRKGSEGDR